MARLKAQERYQKEQLRFVSVLSPIKGVITTPNLKEMVGQQVKKGDLIAKVHELDTVTAEISVSEKEISDVKVGEEVVLRARAFPRTSFHGTVVSIAPTVTQPKEGQVARTILVTTHLDNRSLLLKPEMTGNAKILCGRRRMLDLVTRRLAHYIRVEFWSWW